MSKHLSTGEIRELIKIDSRGEGIGQAVEELTLQLTTRTRQPKELPLKPDPVLCFAGHDCAFFTTQKLSEQRGEDWHHSLSDTGWPYEPGHLVGCCRKPCEDSRCRCQEEFNADGSPKWEIIRVYFVGPFSPPSPHEFSAEEINRGRVPWLVADCCMDEYVHIMAGTSLTEFIRLVKLAGGRVYVEIE